MSSDTSGRRYQFTNMLAAVHGMKQYLGKEERSSDEEVSPQKMATPRYQQFQGFEVKKRSNSSADSPNK